MEAQEEYKFRVSTEDAGQRLDVYLAGKVDDLSRAAVQRLITNNLVTVNGSVMKARYPVARGDKVTMIFVPPEAPILEPEDIPLDILYEDDHLIVINKPPKMVVHPAAGHYSHTLVNALLFYCKNLSTSTHPLRPGIVHRLDRDTSGCLVSAKTDVVHRKLAKMFAERTVEKEYRALAFGKFAENHGDIETYIDRSRKDRKKMAVSMLKGRRALTRFEVIEQFDIASYLRLILETGRTHQIRVHLTHIGHPIIGDLTYRTKNLPPLGVKVPRQMLHAYVLGFNHPITGEHMTFSAPLPDDFLQILAHLRKRDKTQT